MDFKKFLPWIIAAVVLIGIYSWVKGINNTAVTLGQTVEQSWGDVQTSYQRRNDLIGNLVNTVKGAADFDHAGRCMGVGAGTRRYGAAFAAG